MVWTARVAELRKQLNRIANEEFLSSKYNSRRRNQNRKILEKVREFETTLSELKDYFWNEDESIAVLHAVTSYFAKLNAFELARKNMPRPSTDDLLPYKKALWKSHSSLVAKNQQLADKLQSVKETMHVKYSPHCHAVLFTIFAAVTIGGLVTLMIGTTPLVPALVGLGMFLLFLGGLPMGVLFDKLYVDWEISSGVQLKKITEFVDYLDPRTSNKLDLPIFDDTLLALNTPR